MTLSHADAVYTFWEHDWRGLRFGLGLVLGLALN